MHYVRSIKVLKVLVANGASFSIKNNRKLTFIISNTTLIHNAIMFLIVFMGGCVCAIVCDECGRVWASVGECIVRVLRSFCSVLL